MGRMLVYIDDRLEQEFRDIVKKVYGDKKGALSMAVQQALIIYICALKKLKFYFEED